MKVLGLHGLHVDTQTDIKQEIIMDADYNRWIFRRFMQ